METFMQGYKVFWDQKSYTWRYADTGESTKLIRPCCRCGRYPTKGGHDACIANSSGITAACCGHGVDGGYRQLDDGSVEYNDGSGNAISEEEYTNLFIDAMKQS